jgi:hypothetical protein
MQVCVAACCALKLHAYQLPSVLKRKGRRRHNPMLLQNKQSEFCAPLTSFDWNDVDPKRLGTSSIDTTCTIWVSTTELATDNVL